MGTMKEFRKQHLFFYVLFLFGGLIIASICSAREINVSPDGSGDYATIQEAIVAAVSGDVINLQPGTYTGDGNRDIFFHGKEITVRGATGEPNDVIIDCQGSSSDKHRGFNFTNGETPNSILEAVTIINGYGPMESINGNLYYSGGAICCKSSSPTINKCVIRQNIASLGGGIYCENSGPIINFCIIRENYAGTIGGGIYCYSSSPTIRNCVIKENSASNCGGGIYCEGSAATIEKCIIQDSMAVYGGGVFNDYSTTIITHCRIIGNSSSRGGGVYNQYCDEVYLNNCIVSDNLAQEGGGLLNSYSEAFVNSSTIVNNSASNRQGGGIFNTNGGMYPSTSYNLVNVNNSIIWGNKASQSYTNQHYGRIDVTYSDIEGGESGTGNIDIDPIFVEGYHLDPNSECIDAGDPNYIADVNETDIDGNQRVFGIIDMGADEFYVESPWFMVTPTTINFTANGLYTGLQLQTITINNSGTGILNWQISGLTANWFRVAPVRGQISDGNCVITILVDPMKAGYGNHTGQFTVSSADATNSPKIVSVNFNVIGPIISLTPRCSLYTIYAERNTQVEKKFVITNTGYDTLHWQIDVPDGNEWVTFVPDHGKCGRNESNEITLNIDTNGVDNGTYSIYVPINSPETSSSSLRLYVTVYTSKEIHIPQDFNTIQKGVNAAGPDDKIIVHPGRYAGFTISSSTPILTIRSVEPENPEIRAATIIESSVLTPESCRRYIQKLSLEGLSFIRNPSVATRYPPYSALYIENPYNYNECYGSEASEYIIKNCSVRDYSLGIYAAVQNKDRIKIINCEIIGKGTSSYSCSGIKIIGGVSEIRNCLITNNGTGIYLGDYSKEDYHCKTEIVNCTIADNGFGIIITDEASDVIIKNSIIYDDIYNDYDINGPEIIVAEYRGPTAGNIKIDYSLIRGGIEGISMPNTVNLSWGKGNIDTDPCFVAKGFVNDNNTPDKYWDDYWVPGDYHLRSAGWRWNKNVGYWSWDDETSRCIDAGSPGYSLGNELLAAPDDPYNLWGENLRINMGYYGGTSEASIAPYGWALLADMDNSGIVNFRDFAYLTQSYDNSGENQDGDLNRDGIIDFDDVCLFIDDWMEYTDWSFAR
ncbi:MAG: right-handed parallel beta-helix repeat-containing protein [Phycisphaerales bacterium]